MSFKYTKDNKKIVIIAIIVLVMCIVAGMLLFRRIVDQNNNEPLLEEREASAKITNKTKTILYNVRLFDVNMKIPEFNNLPLQYNYYINEKIVNDTDYNKLYNEMTSGIEDKSSIGVFKYSVDYVRYNFHDYISIVINQEMQLGDERPVNKKKIYVINAAKGNSAMLRDVMENKVDYKRKIVEYINTESFKNKIELVGGRGLTSLQDTQRFYIKDDGTLHIYYDPSEVAPASDGALDFEMPFTWQEEGFSY